MTTKENQIQTKKFWDGITHYSDNAMTYTQADFELSQVHKCIDSNQHEQIKDLFGMGVADGLREPISILNHLEQQGRPLPSRLIINDISEPLFNEAKDNLAKGGWTNKIGDDQITYFLGEIEKIDAEIAKVTKIRLAIIGVYNLEYLQNALLLYKKNSHIIGKEFHVYPVYLKNEGEKLVLEHGRTIEFNISNLDDGVIQRIHNNIDQSKKLYAQCVYTTDKHFVSHYFDSAYLGIVIRNIFTGYDVEIHRDEENQRYIVVELKCTKPIGSGITLLTTLNNVLGNIKTDAQMQALNVLKKLID